MFLGFAGIKESMLPALDVIFLECPVDSDDAYTERAERLLIDAEKVDVDVKICPSLSYTNPMWEGI